MYIKLEKLIPGGKKKGTWSIFASSHQMVRKGEKGWREEAVVGIACTSVHLIDLR
jgi:hypothetical protein